MTLQRDAVTLELAALLRAARDRGESFDAAWAAALPVALEHARSDLAARGWREALQATLPEWRAAYDRTPPSTVALGARSILRHHALMGGAQVDLPARHARARYIA